jgi:hypothetical protein
VLYQESLSRATLGTTRVEIDRGFSHIRPV